MLAWLTEVEEVNRKSLAAGGRSDVRRCRMAESLDPLFTRGTSETTAAEGATDDLRRSAFFWSSSLTRSARAAIFCCSRAWYTWPAASSFALSEDARVDRGTTDGGSVEATEIVSDRRWPGV